MPILGLQHVRRLKDPEIRVPAVPSYQLSRPETITVTCPVATPTSTCCCGRWRAPRTARRLHQPWTLGARARARPSGRSDGSPRASRSPPSRSRTTRGSTGWGSTTLATGRRPTDQRHQRVDHEHDRLEQHHPPGIRRRTSSDSTTLRCVTIDSSSTSTSRRRDRLGHRARPRSSRHGHRRAAELRAAVRRELGHRRRAGGRLGQVAIQMGLEPVLAIVLNRTPSSRPSARTATRTRTATLTPTLTPTPNPNPDQASSTTTTGRRGSSSAG